MYFGYVLTLSEGWQLQLGNVIFRAHGIIGRGTVVVGAKTVASPLPNLVGKSVVVKWSWVATTRKEEGYIVKKAVEYADANRPSMRHHLPNIYHYQELPEQTPQCQKFLLANFEDAYEERVLRIVVQEELHPITDLTDATELAEAFKQIFEGALAFSSSSLRPYLADSVYRWLYEGPKIMQRDVSISNLMFQRIDGKLYGVLNDFDLAAFHDGSVPSTSKQRTGTKPYMARDLLTHPPPKHYYRHDLESFLYVLAFLTCDIYAPKSTLGTWIDLGMADLLAAKSNVLAIDGFPPQKSAFEDLAVWIRLLCRLFTEGMSKRKAHLDDEFFARRRGAPPPDFDHETLGGCVTFATFAAVLENPFLQPA
jgi:serine/threonine protein kinase